MGRQPVLPPALMHGTQVARPFHHDGWVSEDQYEGWCKMAAVPSQQAAA